jgi:hypothetical protein
VSASPRAGAAVVADAPDPATLAALRRLASRVVVVGEDTTHRELQRLAAEETVLWLPPWAMVDDAAERALAAWLASVDGDAAGAAVPARCAVAAIALFSEPVAIALPRRVVASTRDAVEVRGERAAARAGAACEPLAAVIGARAPATLSEHLQAVNRQSSRAARLRLEAGERPTVAALAVAPLAILAGALVRARGRRRRALPRAVLESYRDVLATAKLWELREVGPGGARP